MKILSRLSVILILSIHASLSFAWNNFGHEVVADAAYNKLTPAMKARVSVLLKHNPNYDDWINGVPADQQDEVAFMKAATWPDHIKGKNTGYIDDGEDPHGAEASQNVGYSDKLMHKYWHYYDTPFSPDNTPLMQPKVPNAQTQIEAFRKTLSDPNASDELKSYDLVWLLHLVGDVQQPLHATSRFTQDDTDGDIGGNDVHLCSPTSNTCSGKLHSFWDGVLGSSTRIASIQQFASALPKPTAKQAAISDSSKWLEESFKAAKKSVYIDPIGETIGPFTLPPEYKTKAKALARKRAALAGARLANLINDELK